MADWCSEPERFLNIPWVISKNCVVRADSVLYAPGAFSCYGALPDAGGLAARGVRAHVYIAGVAPLVLAHCRSRITMDVDALSVDPRGPVLEAAREVARETTDSTIRSASSRSYPQPGRSGGGAVWLGIFGCNRCVARAYFRHGGPRRPGARPGGT